MLSYILKRLAQAIPVVLGVILVSFVVIKATPGDPILIMVGIDPSASPDTIVNLRRAYGLDDPIPIQYLNYLSRIMRGDFGYDILTGRPVFVEILEAYPRTILLTMTSLAIAVTVGIPLGVIAAAKQYTVKDDVVSVASLAAASVPDFWLGMLLILVFSFYLGLTPVAGYGFDLHLILPSITLGMAMAGVLARITRSTMLEVVRQDFITAARARGLRERTVLMRHALKNTLLPITTVVGIQFGRLLSGAFFVEWIFAWPGIGMLAARAILQRNYPLIQGSVLLVAATFVLINLMVDIMYAYIDPRVQYE